MVIHEYILLIKIKWHDEPESPLTTFLKPNLLQDHCYYQCIEDPFKNIGYIFMYIYTHVCFSGGSVVKNPPANAGDEVLIHRLGRSLGEGGGNLLQYSCLGNLMDRGDWWATDHGVAKVRHNWATKQQCTHIWVMGTLLCVYVFVFALQKGRSDYRFCSVTCNFQFTSWRSFISSLFFLTAVYILWCGKQKLTQPSCLWCTGMSFPVPFSFPTPWSWPISSNSWLLGSACCFHDSEKGPLNPLVHFLSCKISLPSTGREVSAKMNLFKGLPPVQNLGRLPPICNSGFQTFIEYKDCSSCKKKK